MFLRKTATVCLLMSLAACATTQNPWSKFSKPSQEFEQKRLKGRAVGSYSAGCLDGAVNLAPAGAGYQSVREKRNRHYGHPALLKFIESVAQDAAKQGLTFRVADMSQARGGPMPSGHASHQIGLDADIWLWQTPKAQVNGEEDEAPLAVDYAKQAPDPRYWSDASIHALKFVLERPEVERVFINPILKQDLCTREPRPEWLHKLRPWWGHDRHFHVRLKCPEGEPLCRGQKEPIPPGDGCDATLNWWFSDEAKAKGEESEAKPRTLPELPAECRTLLREF